MRIAVSVETKNELDSAIAQHFGRCPFFALVDMEGKEVKAVEVIENPYVQPKTETEPAATKNAVKTASYQIIENPFVSSELKSKLATQLVKAQ